MSSSLPCDATPTAAPALGRPFEKVKYTVPLEQKSLNIDFLLDLYLTGKLFFMARIFATVCK